MSNGETSQHDELQALRTQVQSLMAGAQQSETRLTLVEGKVEDQKKGLIGRFERWGIVIGVFGAVLAIGSGLLALPKAIKEFRSKPETKMVSGWPLEMSYDPVGKKVSFTFAAKVGNDGAKGDTIKEVRASFRPDSVPANQAQFLTTGIKFTEKGVDLRPPFDVGTSSPRELVCTMTTELGNNDLQSVVQPGLNRLHVDLIGDDDKPRASANYCFWVMRAHITDLLGSSSIKAITFVAPYPKCEGEK